VTILGTLTLRCTNAYKSKNVMIVNISTGTGTHGHDTFVFTNAQFLSRQDYSYTTLMGV
jgi:hypothetical protein